MPFLLLWHPKLGGGGGGSTVLFFNGVSTSDGAALFSGVSKPNIALSDAGGGTYNVTKTHSPYDFKTDSVSKETYLIDGVLP